MSASGKTTFLRHIATGDIEGFPRDVRIMHVEQEVTGDDTTVLQCVLNADSELAALIREEAALSALMDAHADDGAAAVAVDAATVDGEAAPVRYGGPLTRAPVSCCARTLPTHAETQAA